MGASGKSEVYIIDEHADPKYYKKAERFVEQNENLVEIPEEDSTEADFYIKVYSTVMSVFEHHDYCSVEVEQDGMDEVEDAVQKARQKTEARKRAEKELEEN